MADKVQSPIYHNWRFTFRLPYVWHQMDLHYYQTPFGEEKFAMNENSSKAITNDNKLHHIFADQQWQTVQTDIQSSGLSALQTYIFLFNFFFIRFSPIPSVLYYTFYLIYLASCGETFTAWVFHSVRKKTALLPYVCVVSTRAQIWGYTLYNMGLILNTYTIEN